MPAAEEPQAGVCAEVLARSYPSPPFGLLKAPFGRCGAISSRASAQGHSRRFDRLPMASDLPLEADIVTAGRHVSKVPRTDTAGYKLPKEEAARRRLSIQTIVGQAAISAGFAFRRGVLRFGFLRPLKRPHGGPKYVPGARLNTGAPYGPAYCPCSAIDCIWNRCRRCCCHHRQAIKPADMAFRRRPITRF